MLRRIERLRFIGRIIVSTLLLLGLLLNVQAKPVTYDWLLIYYMPYDNDLSLLAPGITKQFLNSRINTKTAVTLQVDTRGEGGMMRYSFTAAADSVKIPEENAASVKTFREYLLWAAKRFKASHYAIVLLDHGGGLNEYGLDEYPQKQWLQIDSLADAIRAFKKERGIPKIDMLFEQVCTRATVENLYEFRDIAEYTLASQDLVPAPGYYYPEVFSALDAGRAPSGAALADLIVRSERSDMYYSYTLIDNAKWHGWEKRLGRYADRLRQTSFTISNDNLKILSYNGQIYFDLASLINATVLENGNQRTKETLQQYTREVLIKKLYINSDNDREKGYSGLSICSPFRAIDVPLDCCSQRPYRNYLRALENFRSRRGP